MCGGNVVEDLEVMQVLCFFDPFQDIRCICGCVFCCSGLVVGLGRGQSRLQGEQLATLSFRKHFLSRRDFVANDGVERDSLGELDGLAEHDDGDGMRMREHGDERCANARVETPVGHHGVRAQEHLCGISYRVRSPRDEVVPHCDAAVRELPRQLLAFEERLRVHYNDRERDAGIVRMHYSLLHDRRSCVHHDYVPSLDLGGGQVADQSVCGCDALTDEDVNLLNQVALSFVLRG